MAASKTYARKKDEDMLDDKDTQDRQASAILAGLRLLQAWHLNKVTTQEAQMDIFMDDIETNGGKYDPMSSDEIDELCEQVNCEGIAIGKAVAA
jgi:hypothetical protein